MAGNKPEVQLNNKPNRNPPQLIGPAGPKGGQDVKSENPGEDCMKKLAEVASSVSKMTIVWASQTDSSRMLKSGAMHPLQPLENIHQHLVRQAGQRANPKDRLVVERRALDGYYIDDASEPDLFIKLGVGVNPPPQMKDRVFRDAVDTLTEVTRTVAKLGQAKADRAKLKIVIDKLTDVADKLEATRKAFTSEDPPLLKAAKNSLKDVKNAINAADTWEKLGKICKDFLSPAATSLEKAMGGIARVQMFYDIDAFYLFRLLVRFKVQSDKELTEDDKKVASNALTGILNTKRKFVVEFLRDRLVKLADALANDNDVFFHLKGGRALAYLLRTPEAGENDWDTTIVINPLLPADKWYGKFFKIHDLVLQMLKDFKREFFTLIDKNYDVFMKSLSDALPQQNEDLEDDDEDDDRNDPKAKGGVAPEGALFAAFAGDCKAELIDIGIPRRDTVEALDQWLHTRPRITRQDWTDKIPIPLHLYFIDEYVTMIREVLDGTSQSPKKSGKRILRLYDMLILKDNDLEKSVKAERDHIPGDKIPRSLGLVDNHKLVAIRNLLTPLLKQYAEAHDIAHQGKGFAEIFDQMFVEQKAGALPNDLTASIESVGASFKEEHKELVGWLASSKVLSDQLMAHARKRAEHFGFGAAATEAQKGRRQILVEFIKTFLTLTEFNDEDPMEVQVAVAGSYAAYLHADYRDFSPKRALELEPVTTIDLKVVFYQEGLDLKEIYTAFIKEPLENALKQMEAGHLLTMDKPEPPWSPIYLRWHGDETIDGRKYTPLAIRISIEFPRVWPQLAYIRGIPVLSLRDTIREYDERSATFEEYGTRQTLRKTSGILKEMLTEYDNVPVRQPVVTPG